MVKKLKRHLSIRLDEELVKWIDQQGGSRTEVISKALCYMIKCSKEEIKEKQQKIVVFQPEPLPLPEEIEEIVNQPLKAHK